MIKIAIKKIQCRLFDCSFFASSFSKLGVGPIMNNQQSDNPIPHIFKQKTQTLQNLVNPISSLQGSNKWNIMNQNQKAPLKLGMLSQTSSPKLGHKIYESTTTNKNINTQPKQKQLLNRAEHLVYKFNRDLSEAQKQKNSIQLLKQLKVFLSKRCLTNFIQSCQNFSQLFAKYQGNSMPLSCEKQFLKNVYKMVLEDVKELKKSKQILRLLTHSKIDLIHQIQILISQPLTKNPLQKKIHKTEILPKDPSTPSISGLQPSPPCPRNQTLEFLSELEHNKMQKKKIKSIEIKTSSLSLTVNQNSMRKVQKNLFGNKKIAHQEVVFKRDTAKPNKYEDSFGENWVYAYDLPYSFQEENAVYLIRQLSHKYGPIFEYSVQSYSNIIQKYTKFTVYSLPDNYSQSTARNRIKINSTQYQQAPTSPQQKKKSSLVSRILAKTSEQKDLSLNKSTMLFAFKNKNDKIRFLTKQMRLFGLCFGEFKNVRFEEARAKKIVAVSMLPWGCDSQEIGRLIHTALAPLNLTFTYPKNIITNGFVFLEMNNFYEALNSQKFINAITFKGNKLKAQLCYGSSLLYQGQFKHNFESDHYQKLLERLGHIRNQQSQLLTS